METRHYWEDNGHSVKFESYNASNEEYVRVAAEPVIFAAPSEDEAEYPPNNYLKKGKVSRQDPMSHRIIEKRRRDRMNNCLADLSRLIPPEYLKKGRGRVEKTEIIEMAIRHLKYLQDRVNGLYHTMEQNNKLNNAAENQVGEEHFRAGFQEAMSEAVTFLVEVQGYGPGDGLCLQLATHLQRHCERIAKGECLPSKSQGVSSETTSSSSSTQGYMDKPGVITQARRAEPPPEPPPLQLEPFEEESPSDLSYSMEKDQASEQIVSAESEVSSGTVSRRSEAPDEYLHSYKFKNSIERRFSRSQDCEQPTDMTIRSSHFNGKVIPHKRRRTIKALPSTSNSTSGSGSGSTGEQQCDASPQSTLSEMPHHHFDKSSEDTSQFVPVFALNALGKYYVPLSIDHDCLTRHLGSYSVLEARSERGAAPLHPVTIHVNFQPSLTYRVKRELPDAEWRPA